MNKLYLFLSVLTFQIYPFVAGAQLNIIISPPKIVAQKAVIKMLMKNELTSKVESARAVCFLFDDQGKMIGQSTKWVIGQNKIGLESGGTNSFNFVITSSQPFATTNLTAKVSFNRVVFADGKLADVKSSVMVTESAK